MVAIDQHIPEVVVKVNRQRSGCLRPENCFFNFETFVTPSIDAVDLLGETELIIGNDLDIFVTFNETLSENVTAFTGDAECQAVTVTELVPNYQYKIRCTIGEVLYGTNHRIKFIDPAYGSGIYANATYSASVVVDSYSQSLK